MNPNMNIVRWFSDYIFGKLQAASGSGIPPGTAVYAIWYLYTFRYQLCFVSSTHISIATDCLELQEVVVYMYAAVELDRILSMHSGGSMTPMYALPSLPLPHLHDQIL